MTLARWSLAFALVALATQAQAAGPNQYKPRQCIGKDGQLYSTSASSCPSSMPEVRKKIHSCILADGSKTFGDQCPTTAKTGEQIDSQELSQRSSGLTNGDRRGHQRLLIQGRMREASAIYRRTASEYEYERERRLMELEAEREAYEEDLRLDEDN